jgi:beta-glucosidase
VFDWGQGVLTLRNVANGNVLGFDGGRLITRDDQPNGWFVQQQFKLEEQADGTYVIRYAGYDARESWFGGNTYVTVLSDGRLTLGASSAAGAARFARTTIRSGVDSAVELAEEADAAIVVVGSMPFINGRENSDRASMALAEGQARLVKAVLEANPNTIMVLETSYPVTVDWEQENVPAILWTTHAGQETGNAIADVLFGQHNPSGRLTQTWYRAGEELPSIFEYDIIRSNRTYQYFDGSPLYPFGHGLSYTTFRYSDIETSASSISPEGSVDVSVRVTNTGTRAGAEVVQLYTHQRTSRNKQPIAQLRAFRRVHLAPGESRTVRLTVRATDLAHWDVTRSREVVERAVHDLLVGSSLTDIRQRASVFVRGERIPPRDLSQVTRAENFDRYAGVVLVDESKVDGTTVESNAAGGWAEYADAALSTEQRVFTARVAKESAGSGRIEVRLDAPDGPLAGAAEVPSTGDRYRYATVTAPLDGVSGRHDVYVVISAGIRVASFSLDGP